MIKHSPGIRAKLIIIFILIKVLPLIALAWYSWDQISKLTSSVEKQSIQMISNTHNVVSMVSALSTENSIRALDEKSRETIERITTDTAQQVATFLYERDRDILLASQIVADELKYKKFLKSRSRAVIYHKPWVMAESGDHWIPSLEKGTQDENVISATNKDNINPADK